MPARIGSATRGKGNNRTGGQSRSPSPGGTPVPAYDISISVNRTTPTRASLTELAYNYIDNTLKTSWGGINATAVTRMEALLPTAFPNVATHITPLWGAREIWPNQADPAPTDYGDLDRRFSQSARMGTTPILYVGMQPWWMKGQLQSNGTTLLGTADSGDQKRYRVLDNQVNNKWATMVRAVVNRYCNPAGYNCKTFVIWNELAGYFSPITQRYDMSTSSGEPANAVAKHGFTYFYEQTRSHILAEFALRGWSTTGLKFGGPYPHLDHYGTAAQVAGGASNASSELTGAWGVADKRLHEAIEEFYANVTPGHVDFITVDGKNAVQAGTELTSNEFTQSDFFYDATQWVHDHIDSDIPVWWTEWYSVPMITNPLANNAAFKNALASYALIRFVEAGTDMIVNWGGVENGMSGSLADNAGIEWHTQTGTSAGGFPTGSYYTFKAITDNFGPGTNIYPVNLGGDTRIKVLASTNHKIIVNKTNASLVLSDEGTLRTLGAYEVLIT